ncbi:hypothetical protein [Parafrankia discariae]|uniref:hypothetical protein n=1 Tax=Parafrankia discariae TaxID=365528 RepID=UPI00037646AA|nr:hypothetical protein [Parafrankia discariae]
MTGEPARERDSFVWTDPDTGHRWQIDTTWRPQAGRWLCTALTMAAASPGAAVTSRLVRLVEAEARARGRIRARPEGPTPPGDDDPEIAAARERLRGAGRLRPVDATWLDRCAVMRRAWREGRPMAAGLAERWPGNQPATYDRWVERARTWDRTTASGLLDTIGRPAAR